MNLVGFPGSMPPKKKQNFAAFGNEEFKMHEDEDDNIDLLNEKKKSQNLDEFYQNAGCLNDLKSQIMMNMPEGMGRMGNPSMS